MHQRRAGEADLGVPRVPRQEDVCSASTACKVLSAWGLRGDKESVVDPPPPGAGARRAGRPGKPAQWDAVGSAGGCTERALGQPVGVEPTGRCSRFSNGNALPQGETDSGGRKSNIKLPAGPHSL